MVSSSCGVCPFQFLYQWRVWFVRVIHWSYLIIPISAIGRENICEITNVKCSIEIDVHNYKNSISYPERGFFLVSETLCAAECGDNGRRKNKYIFSSPLMYIPLKITFLSDKQAATLNCSSSSSELTFSLISQFILRYFEEILCEKTVLMIQVISYNKIL